MTLLWRLARGLCVTVGLISASISVPIAIGQTQDAKPSPSAGRFGTGWSAQDTYSSRNKHQYCLAHAILSQPIRINCREVCGQKNVDGPSRIFLSQIFLSYSSMPFLATSFLKRHLK